jgi:hypothetical protein
MNRSSCNYWEAALLTGFLDRSPLPGPAVILLAERLGRYDISYDLIESCIHDRYGPYDSNDTDPTNFFFLEQLACIALIQQKKYFQAALLGCRLLERGHLLLNPQPSCDEGTGPDIMAIFDQLRYHLLSMTERAASSSKNNSFIFLDAFLIAYSKMLLYFYHMPYEVLCLLGRLNSRISDNVHHMIGVAWLELTRLYPSMSGVFSSWARHHLELAVNSSPLHPGYCYTMAIHQAVFCPKERAAALDTCTWLLRDLSFSLTNQDVVAVSCLSFLLHAQSGIEMKDSEPISSCLPMIWLRAKWAEWTDQDGIGWDSPSTPHPSVPLYCTVLEVMGKRMATRSVSFHPVRELSIAGIAGKKNTPSIAAASIVTAGSGAQKPPVASSDHQHRTVMDYYCHPLLESWAIHRRERVLLPWLGRNEPDFCDLVTKRRHVVPYLPATREKEVPSERLMSRSSLQIQSTAQCDTSQSDLSVIPPCLLYFFPPTFGLSDPSSLQRHQDITLISIIWTELSLFFQRQGQWNDAREALAEACKYDECNPYVQLALGAWNLVQGEPSLAITHYLLVLEMYQDGYPMSWRRAAWAGLSNAFKLLNEIEQSKHYRDLWETHAWEGRISDIMHPEMMDCDIRTLEQQMSRLVQEPPFLVQPDLLLPFYLPGDYWQ